MQLALTMNFNRSHNWTRSNDFYNYRKVSHQPPSRENTKWLKLKRPHPRGRILEKLNGCHTTRRQWKEAMVVRICTTWCHIDQQPNLEKWVLSHSFVSAESRGALERSGLKLPRYTYKHRKGRTWTIWTQDDTWKRETRTKNRLTRESAWIAIHPVFFHLARGANAQGVTLSIQTRKIINRTGTYSLQIWGQDRSDETTRNMKVSETLTLFGFGPQN